MKVTFDSNVWEKIINPETSQDQRLYTSLRQSILNGLIEPYICEISLTLEAVQKKDRLKHRRNFSLIIRDEEWVDDGDKIKGRVSIGPSPSSHPKMPEQLHEKFSIACNMGFKVLAMTNFGTPRINGIPKSVKAPTDEYWGYAQKLSECSEFIKSLGCGRKAYDDLKEKLELNVPITFADKLIDEENQKPFYLAVAEWADGDSLSAHYAYGNDYFCTNDQGKSAGKNSVFHKSKIESVRNQFGVKVVTAEQLKDLLVLVEE